MDLIENLAKQASQITMYDVKSYYNQARNMVLNVSEMEAKVREATNDDPWGASSTLMMQIAEGTHTYSSFNEIMPSIYSRFMEKEAREWRQIYKALSLLEFLVKNGSERVVDDARAHVSTIKMLRSFHYVDEKGKDQGINVRNRASEIALLLGDVEKIRQERRKAKANRNKYQGGGNEGGMSFITPGGSRYGGFGSDSVGGAGAGRSGYGGDADEYRGSSRSFRDTAGPQEFDQYEGADDFDDAPPRRTTSASTSRSNSRPQPPPKTELPKVEKPVEKPKEVNLFDFGDDEPVTTPAAAPVPAAAPILGGDDDFDDFQTAPSAAVSPTLGAAPKPAVNSNLFNILNSSTSTIPQQPQPQAVRNPSFSAAPPPMYGGGMTSPPMAMGLPSRPSYTTAPSANSVARGPAVTSPAASKPSAASTFDDLWTTSLGSSSNGNTAAKPTGFAGQAASGKTIKDLEREKAMNKLWGSGTPTSPSAGGYGTGLGGSANQPAKPSGGGGFDDLLL